MYAATFARTAARRVSVSRMPQAISQRAYHENIVEHYENPRNVGSLDKNDDNVGTVSWFLLIIMNGLCIRSGEACHHGRCFRHGGDPCAIHFTGSTRWRHVCRGYKS